MVRRGDAQTLSADVYGSLRAGILAAEFPPGARLLPGELAARYSARPGVIREALARLAAEGLTTLEPNRGFRVIEVSRQNIIELLELRRINEGAAIRLAVDHLDTEHEASILAAMHMLRAVEPGPQRAPTHRGFHRSLLSACPNKRLLRLCETLFESSELYRHWSAAALQRPAHVGGRNQDGEHEAIMEAVLAHDTELAVERHLLHLQRTVDLALEYIDARDAALAANQTLEQIDV